LAVSRKAKSHLSRDPKLAQIISVTKLRPRQHDGDIYRALLRSIIYQQLSGKAAATIHKRFLDLFPDGYPHASQLVTHRDDQLREAGLSRQKSGYLRNVASHWMKEDLDEVNWSQLSDEQILTRLTAIKGVGTWTVQMLLMFNLKRPDVFPLGDLGIRNAVIKKYRLRSKGKSLDRRLLRIAEPWRPYRTLASLYLWSWLDGCLE
jgi:DNA-3-methyladenine glycosylase II